MNLTWNFYAQWYWETDLHKLLKFLNLRGDAYAQDETRVHTTR